MDYYHIKTNKKDLPKDEYNSEVYNIAICKYQIKDIIKEVISKAIDIHMANDPNFTSCEDNDPYICEYGRTITVKEMRDILNSVQVACSIETCEYAYDTKAEWEKAMKQYENGMLNLALYLDYFWI